MQKKIFNKFIAVGITDVGKVRKHNEDNILIDENLGLLLVADGMGGHEAGEVASREAIKVIRKLLQLQLRELNHKSWFDHLFSRFRTPSLNIKEKQAGLENALYEANKHIYQLNVDRNARNGSGMGTTVAGCWLISADTMLVFHVGDSRIYREREGKLQALSKDHSMYQLWLDSGSEGEMPSANIIHKAVGPYQSVEAEINTVKILERDSFLVCSDGLSDMVDDAGIEVILQAAKGGVIDLPCQKLLGAALESGGKDNVSIIWMTAA